MSSLSSLARSGAARSALPAMAAGMIAGALLTTAPCARASGATRSSPVAASTPAVTTSPSRTATSEAPVPVVASKVPPPGRKLSADRVLEIAEALPKMKAVRAKYRGSYGGAYLKG
ncbi:MAG TPA: hypothetical protein VMG80_03940, partial [Solirubrobacteraceae bacterium]|nr:hypothetical protein [Solirubrobacteraceae bacterium]